MKNDEKSVFLEKVRFYIKNAVRIAGCSHDLWQAGNLFFCGILHDSIRNFENLLEDFMNLWFYNVSHKNHFLIPPQNNCFCLFASTFFPFAFNMSDSAVFNQLKDFFASSASLQDKLEKFAELDENCFARAVSKKSFISGSVMSDMGKAIGIAVSNKSKLELGNLIKNYFNQRAAVNALENPGTAHPHVYMINTFPRLCNLLMRHPDALAKTQLLGSRLDLDAGAVYENNTVFVEAVAQFNDRSVNTGGNQFYDPTKPDNDLSNPPLLKNINPEAPGSGVFSAKAAWRIFMQVKKDYAEARRKFGLSGHNNPNFVDYCAGNADVLYLHMWVEHLNITELTSFCSSGSIIEGGGRDGSPG